MQFVLPPTNWFLVLWSAILLSKCASHSSDACCRRRGETTSWLRVVDRALVEPQRVCPLSARNRRTLHRLRVKSRTPSAHTPKAVPTNVLCPCCDLGVGFASNALLLFLLSNLIAWIVTEVKFPYRYITFERRLFDSDRQLITSADGWAL